MRVAHKATQALTSTGGHKQVVHLAANLNDSTVRSFNRISFNHHVATMLDTLADQPERES